ncbi:MAG: flavoprotein [Solirubrobacterales bacterium]
MPNVANTTEPVKIAILGAGPVGLEAALAAAERGWSFRVYEASLRPAGHVRSWGHVRAFTPWDMNVSPRAEGALTAAGIAVPSEGRTPTGDELADELLDPLAGLDTIAPHIRLGHKVLAVGRQGLLKHEEISSPERAARPFSILVSGPDGERIEHAEAVLDCTGTYGKPNTLGDAGIPAPGETELADRIDRRIPDLTDPAGWAGQIVLLTGAGHSAQTAARELAELARQAPDTRVIWSTRSPSPDWGAVDNDPLPARAELNAAAAALARGDSGAVEFLPGHVTSRLAERVGKIAVTLANGSATEVEVDRVLSLNGGIGDNELYRQLQVHECYATCGPITLSAALLEGDSSDCMAQGGQGADVLRNPEPRFFIVGAKSYGRNSQFLMRTGWQQVDDVIGILADELAGAPA